MESHIADTLLSGDGLCDEEIVRCVVEEAGDRIRDLLAVGVEFEREETISIMSRKADILPEGFYTQRMLLERKLKGHSTKRSLKVKE